MPGPVGLLSRPMLPSRGWTLALALVALFSLVSVAPARAATIVVTTASNGIIDSGECSLPEALANAENDALTHDDCLIAGNGYGVLVTLNGSPVTAGSTVTLPAGTSQATLLIQRQAAGRGSTVAFEAVDVCGAWPTFVGGGPNAF